MTIFGALARHDPVALSWQFAGLTDIGRVRANNEDAIAFDCPRGVAILADGMGGHNGGEVASAMAVALLQARLGEALSHVGVAATRYAALRRLFETSVDEINRAIYKAGQLHSHLKGMGTTLVLAAFGSKQVIVGHVGDSRCYRLRSGQLEMLTRDHSLLRRQLDAGEITRAEADRSPYRNLVTRALGIEPQVLLEMHDHEARTGDLFLLCSDGLSEMVKDDDIGRHLSRNIGLSEKAALLIETANENGGRDNISVVLASATEDALLESACPEPDVL